MSCQATKTSKTWPGVTDMSCQATKTQQNVAGGDINVTRGASLVTATGGRYRLERRVRMAGNWAWRRKKEAKTFRERYLTALTRVNGSI